MSPDLKAPGTTVFRNAAIVLFVLAMVLLLPADFVDVSLAGVSLVQAGLLCLGLCPWSLTLGFLLDGAPATYVASMFFAGLGFVLWGLPVYEFPPPQWVAFAGTGMLFLSLGLLWYDE